MSDTVGQPGKKSKRKGGGVRQRSKEGGDRGDHGEMTEVSSRKGFII